MNLEKTYFELIEFNKVATEYIEKHKATESKPAIENKLTTAIKQFNKQLIKIFEIYNDERDNLQLDNCLTYKEGDKKGAIMKDEKGQRMYSVDSEKKLKKELKALIDRKVECHSRIPEGVEELIPTLTDAEKEVFSGLIIPEQPKIEDNDNS